MAKGISLGGLVAMKEGKFVGINVMQDASNAVSELIEFKRLAFKAMDEKGQKMAIARDPEHNNVVGMNEEVDVNGVMMTPFLRLQAIAEGYGVYSFVKGKKVVDSDRILVKLTEWSQQFLAGFTHNGKPQVTFLEGRFVLTDRVKQLLEKVPTPSMLHGRRRDGEITVLEVDRPVIAEPEAKGKEKKGIDAPVADMPKEAHAKSVQEADEKKSKKDAALKAKIDKLVAENATLAAAQNGTTSVH